MRNLTVLTVTGAVLGLMAGCGEKNPAAPGPGPTTNVASQTTATNAAKVAAAPGLEPLPLKLPTPAFKGTPPEMPKDTTAEKPTGKARPDFLAPKGVQNVALNKKVTCSDKAPMTGAPELVTDGDKDAGDGKTLVMRRNTQYVQIDLENVCTMYAILIWHAHDEPKIFRDVVVQVADDPDFIDNVRTLFNNDQDNSSGLGIGADREYFENYEGKLIDAKGAKARYIRFYSKGNTRSAFNEYTEIEIWGFSRQ